MEQGKTECYDCNEKETPKTFPVCTIRSTPSQPIHCIVWAKSYLFTEIFGTSEDDAADLDHTEDSENASEIEKLREEANALKNIRQSMGSDEFARNIFEKVFNLDIIRLRSMEDMWKNRDKPDALSYDKLAVEPWISDLSVAPRDQKAWTLEENFAVFMDSIHRLSKRLQAAQAESSDIDKPPILAFDKDDADTLDFVASTANLRSIVFGIPTSSKFDIKQMAGNIIPAIATTNAMTASLCVLQSFKVIKGQLEKAKMVYLECLTDRVVSSGKLLPPKPECSVCSVTQARLLVDTSRATLHDLVEDFLRLELGYGEEFSVNNEVGTLYDPEDNENLPKMLSELGIKGDSFLTIIDDDEENPRVNLVLSITDKSLPQESKPVCAPEKFEVARKPKTSISPTPDGLPNGHTNGATKNDATLKVNGNAEGHTNGNTETNGVTKKRKLSQSSVVEETNPAKRGKVKEAAILIIDDDGSIMID
ncbi:MAG: E1 ubiquitin-activating protein uba2 [Trizodia sp. TS-e1964]|nr:MAG: E1 ubiquitin-activating protein uba2 [Trizodia sp. TS-e1964]